MVSLVSLCLHYYTLYIQISLLKKILLGLNLQHVLKSRDITLPTKFCIVKAVVSPVVMYRCES